MVMAVTFSLIVFMGWGNSGDRHTIKDKKKNEEPEEIIIKIYDEVKEMGLRDGEDFLKREFHFDLDGRRENREEHILVFSYFSHETQLFSIQITYYQDMNEKDFKGRAKEIRDIDCMIKDHAAEINECGYDQKEVKGLLLQILEGIKREKEILKLVRNYSSSLKSNQ